LVVALGEVGEELVLVLVLALVVEGLALVEVVGELVLVEVVEFQLCVGVLVGEVQVVVYVYVFLEDT
jgi:hypothetical protein